jgi:hypothetical protein
MDEIAQNRQRFVLRGFDRERNGIPHPETHAQMFGP